MMEDEKKEYDELLKKVDDVEFVPEEKLEEMDFYELAYYMQTLNQVSKLGDDESREEDGE